MPKLVKIYALCKVHMVESEENINIFHIITTRKKVLEHGFESILLSELLIVGTI